MILIGSPPSPFVGKVRMAARICGIELDERVVDTQPEPDELLVSNPLGKVPALILDDGTALFDSPVICEYLDRRSGNRLIPQTDAEWLAAKRLEAAADGIADAAILVVYESRFRPDEKRHEPWTDRQWRKALRGLAALEREIGEVPAEPTVGHVAVASLTTWLGLRFESRWEAEHPALAKWRDDFFAAFPALVEARPKLG